jgi:hypothetical protein
MSKSQRDIHGGFFVSRKTSKSPMENLKFKVVYLANLLLLTANFDIKTL